MSSHYHEKSFTCGQFAAHTEVKIVFDAFAVAEASEHNERKRSIRLSAITNDFVLSFRGIQRHGACSNEVLANDSVVKIDINEFYAAITTSSNNKILIQLNGEIGAAT